MVKTSIRMFPVVLFVLICNYSCTRIKNPIRELHPIPVTGTDVNTIKTEIRKAVPAYHFITTDSLYMYAAHNDSIIHLAMALNRIDLNNIGRLDSLIVPDTFYSDFNIYSPFPDSLLKVQKIPKLIVFAYPIQAFAAYEYGVMVRWGPVSMGKKSTLTPTGLFFTNWKAKETVSTENEEWIMKWYFNLDNRRGVSMHQYDLPGFPASHACVRLHEDDAYWFYYWAEQWILADPVTIVAKGTPVIIYGTYPFGKQKPWMFLPEDKEILLQRTDTLNRIMEQYLPEIERAISEWETLKSIANH